MSGHGYGPLVEVGVPVRVSVGCVSDVLGELRLHTVELTDHPRELQRPDVRAELAGLLEAAAAELRHPPV